MGRKRIWTKELCQTSIDSFIAAHNRPPTHMEMNTHAELCDNLTFKNHVGMTFTKYIKKNHPQYTVNYRRKETARQQLSQYVDTYGELPSHSECTDNKDLPSPSVLKTAFGMSLAEYGAAFHPGVPLAKRRRTAKETKLDPYLRGEYINALESYIAINACFPREEDIGTDENAWLPTNEQFKKATGYSYHQYIKDYYPDLIKSRAIYSREQLAQIVDEFVSKHGRRPTQEDFNGDSRYPSPFTFQRRFGMSLYEYCKVKYPGLSANRFAKEQIRWDRDTVEQMFDAFVEQHGRLPEQTELNKSNYLSRISTLTRALDEPLADFMARRYPDLPQPVYSRGPGGDRGWSRERIVKALDDFIRTQERLPASKDFTKKNGLPSSTSWETYMKENPTVYLAREYPQYKQPKRQNRKGDARWTEERIAAAIKAFVEQNNRLPQYSDFTPDMGLPCYGTWVRCMKVKETIGEYLNRSFPEYQMTDGLPRANYKSRWSKEQIAAAIEAFVRENGRLPLHKDFSPRLGLPSFNAWTRCMNEPISVYLKREFPDYTRPKKQRKPKPVRWTEERIVAAIDAFVEQNKRPPRSAELQKSTGLPSYSTWKRIMSETPSAYHHRVYGKQNDTRGRAPSWTRDQVTDAIAAFISKHHRLPQYKELRWSNGLPSLTTCVTVLKESLSSYLAREYPDVKSSKSQHATRETCITAYSDYVERHKVLPTAKALASEYPNCSYSTFKRCVGETPTGYGRRVYPHLYTNQIADPEAVTQAIRAFVEKYERLPTSSDYRFSNNLPSYTRATEILGEPVTAYIKREYPALWSKRFSKYSIWTPESCANAVQAFVDTNKRFPLTSDFIRANGLPSYGAFTKVMGKTASEYLQHNYEEMRNSTRQNKRDRCESTLLAFIGKHGRPPTIREQGQWRVNGLVSRSVFQRQMGCTPNEFLRAEHPQLWEQTNLPETPMAFKEAIDAFRAKHGRLPLYDDFRRRNNLPTRTRFIQIMGESPARYIDRTYGEHDDAEREGYAEQVKAFIETNHRLPRSNEFQERNGMPPTKRFKEIMGEPPGTYLKRVYHEEKAKYRTEECRKAVKDFIERHQRLPRSDEFHSKNGLPSEPAFRRIMGEPAVAYCKRTYPELLNTRINSNAIWNRDKCIQALTDYVKRNGKAPSSNGYTAKNALPSHSVFNHYVGMWPGTYAKTNLSQFLGATPAKEPPTPAPRKQPRVRKPKLPKAGVAVVWNRRSITDALLEFSRQYDRYPSKEELSPEHSLPAERTIELIFESSYHQVVNTIHQQALEQAALQEKDEPDQEEDGHAWAMSM